MLHNSPNVILPETWDVLKALQSDEVLSDFFLVGGTALALQLGHRLSVDLDLFTLHTFNTQKLSDHLLQQYNFQVTSISKNTILGITNGIKTDFITHAYPMVENLLQADGLRLASLKDISAMKLNAIAHSGQRLKDFIDVFVLLEQFPLKVMLDSYALKYPNSNIMIPLKGLTYFEDLDIHEDKPILNRNIEFPAIRTRLLEAVENPEKIFSKV